MCVVVVGDADGPLVISAFEKSAVVVSSLLSMTDFTITLELVTVPNVTSPALAAEVIETTKVLFLSGTVATRVAIGVAPPSVTPIKSTIDLPEGMAVPSSPI